MIYNRGAHAQSYKNCYLEYLSYFLTDFDRTCTKISQAEFFRQMSAFFFLKGLPTIDFCSGIKTTVDSRSLEFQGTLWNTSRYPYLDISDLQNLGEKIEQPHLANVYVIWLLFSIYL